MRLIVVLIVTFVGFLQPALVRAQSAPSTPATSVPRLIQISGVYHPADGQPAAPVETVTVVLYAEETEGTPLWQETQSISVDGEGRYSLLLGATETDGVPLDVFASGEARWLSLAFARPGEIEGPRTRMTSVPYALSAGDAATVGGYPASAFVRAASEGAAGGVATASTATSDDPIVTPQAVLPGTANALAKYVDAADVGASTLSEVSGRLGINTGAALPADYLHVKFNDPFGAFTGLAVQNTSNNANAASGMLFYDHNGVISQFQGFNNTNHAYVINNIARNGASQFDGSYNFLIGNSSRLFVSTGGNVGIGTTSPAAILEVSNAVTGIPSNVWTTSFTNFLGPYYLARRARGTAGAPAAVQNGDGLSGLYGMGYGTTQFGPASTGGITIQAAQNFTDTQQGTAITFSTTAINAATPTTRMTLDASGNLGIGTTTVPAAGILEVSNASAGLSFSQITASTFGNGGLGSLFVGRRARGTAIAPTAVQGGDVLVGYLAQGYGTSGFSGTRGGMFVVAAENWSNAAQGTRLAFNTTMTGTTAPGTRMTLDPSGNLGIGTTTPSATVEAFREGDVAVVQATSFSDGECCAAFVARKARGTAAAPAAVQLGDLLGLFIGDGYGTTQFGSSDVGMLVLAGENWTDTAQGAAVAFTTTPLGSTEETGRMVIMPDGNVGIGTFNDFPTLADKLQVFGDIRVGTSGTNGCINNFAGTGLVGTCSSDGRLKKNITPFGPVLGQLTSLQPVHYFWRASEFPNRHFGNEQNYGLIAQDVEQVLPELVVTDQDGFKAVDYSKLPLLTIQAVKELKSENDALKLRVAELERLMTEMLVTIGRR